MYNKSSFMVQQIHALNSMLIHSNVTLVLCWNLKLLYIYIFDTCGRYNDICINDTYIIDACVYKKNISFFIQGKLLVASTSFIDSKIGLLSMLRHSICNCIIDACVCK